MTINEGVADRVVRITAGFLILSMFFLADGNARWFALVGVVPFITGIVGWCPVYSLFKFQTCPVTNR